MPTSLRRLGPPPVRGAMLLQASFLILVLMGLASVVIDLGIARLTQAQMQGAVDSASLEGMRTRDDLGDLDRRRAAGRFAALTADGDLNLNAAQAGPLQGLGPVFRTGVAGIGNPVGGTLQLEGPYKPTLQANPDNFIHGDIVAGTYQRPDPNLPNPDWNSERANYTRLDFAPAAAADAPTAPGLLVRARRTNDRLGLDRQDGVSSAGPTVPFLFGLGSAVLSSPDPDTYDPRRDGLTVRATAISEARPALAAGPGGLLTQGVAIGGLETVGDLRQLGLAFEDTSWRLESVTGATIQIEIDPSGAVTGFAGGSTPGLTGNLLPLTPLLRVGDSFSTPPVTGVVNLQPATQLTGLAYVGLYAIGATGPQVTGLAAVDIQSVVIAVDVGGAQTAIVTAIKLPSLVAPINASAVPSLAEDLSVLLPEDGARQLLLAPVLAR